MALCRARLLQKAEVLVQILLVSCLDSEEEEDQSREQWQRNCFWAYGRSGSKGLEGAEHARGRLDNSTLQESLTVDVLQEPVIEPLNVAVLQESSVVVVLVLSQARRQSNREL